MGEKVQAGFARAGINMMLCHDGRTRALPRFLLPPDAPGAPPRAWLLRRNVLRDVLALDGAKERAACSLVAEKYAAAGKMPDSMTANATMVEFLKAAGLVASNANSSNTVLCSPEYAYELAISAGARGPVLDALEALLCVDAEGDMNAHELRAAVAVESRVTAMPATFEEVTVIQAAGPNVYTLTEEERAPRFNAEAQALRAFCSADVNLDRSAAGAPNALSTVDKMIDDVARFLGFLVHVTARLGPATVEWLLDGVAIMSYAAWLLYIRKRKAISLNSTLRSLLSALRAYSVNLTGADARDASRLQARLAQLCNALYTAAQRDERPTRERLAEEGKWHDLAALARLWDGALEHWRVCMRTEGRTPDNAQLLQALTFGGLTFRCIAALRPRCVAAFCTQRRCVDDICQDPGCTGNYVENGMVRIKHDKTEASHGPREMPCPPLLQELVEEWERWGRAKLVKTDTNALFIDPSTGGALTRKRMSAYLRNAMRLLSGEEEFPITFTALRRGLADAVAPLPYEEREAVARTAGTSIAMLTHVYDIQRRQRQAAQGAQIYQVLLPLPDAAAAEDEESDADAEVVAQGAPAALPLAGTPIPTGVLATTTALALAGPAGLAAAGAVAAVRPGFTSGTFTIPSGTGMAQRDALMTRVRQRQQELASPRPAKKAVGRPVTMQAVPGTVAFSEADVKEMDTAALRAGFYLRFGRETQSGNLTYLRNALQRVYNTDAQEVAEPPHSDSD